MIIAVSILALESARSGVSIDRFTVGTTPVTSFAQPGADGPVVIVAHGFAGSSQMMQGYTLPLARAGFRVFAFDFLGHGRHPTPMSGDVGSVEGTTRLLVDQTKAVMDSISDDKKTVALLGHSMATDVLVRVAAERENIGPVVLLSAFSEVIDATTPSSLLLVVGAWEPRLRDFAFEAVRMVQPEADVGATVSNGPVLRRAAVVPWTEHASILQSSIGRQEALLWLDQSFARSSDITILPTGPAIVGLLTGLVVLFASVARLLPARDVPAVSLSRRRFALITVVPMLVTPPLAVMLDPGFMPVLIADYLALHLAIYGGLQLVILIAWRVRFGTFVPLAFVLLMVGCGSFGFALDRYVANFWPNADRLWIMALLFVGSILFFVPDVRLAHRSSIWTRLLLHSALLISLLIAVSLDFEGLFFLLMIAPVIVLFYIIFGTMGHAVSMRSGPLASGVALGLLLAWSLGVSFPLFQS